MLINFNVFCNFNLIFTLVYHQLSLYYHKLLTRWFMIQKQIKY